MRANTAMFNPEIKGVASLPNGHADRDAVARQIREGREHDKQKKWKDIRNGAMYSYTLRGVSETFEQVRSFGQSKVILDIGTGSSKGIQEIAQSPFAEGLSFKATSLTQHEEHGVHLPKKDIILTSAEVLRGVRPASIGCILAVRSIGYTERPTQLIARLDQVLAEGGFIKAVFPSLSTELKERTGKEFADAFIALGYDVAYTPGKVFKIFVTGQLGGDEVLLARKPYKDPTKDPHPVSAKEIIALDQAHSESEVAFLKKKD
jgi:hypothetical protein